MTPQEHEQYEWLVEKSFDDEHPMPERLVHLHEIAATAGRRIGLTSVPKPTMVCLAIMAGCFDTNTDPAPVLDPPKRRPGRPTNKERAERALAEVT
jgi:hypothetical protein